MSNTSVTPSTLEFLRWVAARPRTYRETMDAWRTSCPRLSVWEDALLGGLVQVHRRGNTADADEPLVSLTARGREVLDTN